MAGSLFDSKDLPASPPLAGPPGPALIEAETRQERGAGTVRLPS